MGRKAVKIDWQMVDELLEAGCSGQSIADAIGIAIQTLSARCLEDNEIDWSEYKQMKKSKGDNLLRKIQWDAAKNGDKTMMIWLGKNRLGQKDKTESDVNVNIPFTKIEIELAKENQLKKDNTESKESI